MKRSEIRQNIATQIAALSVPTAWRRPGQTAFVHAKTTNLAPGDPGTVPHLSFFVQAMRWQGDGGRGNAGSSTASQYVVTLFYVVKPGSSGSGEWTDVDAATDLADYVAFSLNDASGADDGYTPVVRRIDVADAPTGDLVTIQITIEAHHRITI